MSVEVETVGDDWLADRLDRFERDFPGIRDALDGAKCSCCYMYDFEWPGGAIDWSVTDEYLALRFLSGDYPTSTSAGVSET